MTTTAKQRYDKKYYLDHKKSLSEAHSKWGRDNPREYKKRKVELTEVLCIGSFCWPRGLTFMSPDPSRVRRCARCIVYAEERNP